MSGEEKILEAIGNMQKDITELKTGQDKMQKDIIELKTNQDKMQSNMDKLNAEQKGTAKEFANLVNIIIQVKSELKQEINDKTSAIQKELTEFKSETNRNFKLVDVRFKLFEDGIDRRFNYFEDKMDRKFKEFKNDFGTKMEDGFEQVNERIDNLIHGEVEYVLKTNERIERLENQAKLA